MCICVLHLWATVLTSMAFEKTKKILFTTSLATIELMTKISIDKNEYTFYVFLDLAKAFDTMNHGK